MLENKESNQKTIFLELFSARKSGYITDIQAILKVDENNRISYDPDQAADDANIPATIVKHNTTAEEAPPPCSEIFVKFAETVSSQRIEEVSKYLENKYGCKSTVYPNKRLDLYSFK